MASYRAPLREINFVLNDVLKAGDLSQLPAFQDVGSDMITNAIEEAAKLIEEQLAPLHMSSDAGCKLVDGEVQTPAGYAELYKQFWQGGWVGIGQKPEYGGAGLPYLVSKVVDELTSSANVAFALYPGLTTGCFEAIEHCGNAEQRERYCHKLATGEWTGTMCITEPHAGSDVGSIKT